MKHLYRAAMVLLLSASLSYGAALGDNNQFQTQFDGGFAGAGGGVAGFIGGAAGYQTSDGFSLASPGDNANENTQQAQSTYEFTADSDGAGNFAAVETFTLQGQDRGSFSDGGVAGSSQDQSVLVGAAGLTVGGQFGVAGSFATAEASGGSGALGLAGAGQSQTQVGVVAYEQQSVGATSYTYQAGYSEVATFQESGAVLIGAGGSQASVTQAGGSLVLSDGNAGAMSGQATAAGDAQASSGSIGIAGAQAEAFGFQEHSYQQEAFSADGTNYQGQQGYVSTTVQASSVSP